MRPWQFSKPKNPGFGISRNYYLSALCSQASLPPIVEIANPGGIGGAVDGLAVPVQGDADKERLLRPLERGVYAVSTRDRKSVLKMLILSPDEAGFEPEAFARSPLALEADPEIVARVRATWNLAQFTFMSHDPMVYPAMDFIMNIVNRLASVCQGVVADPICQRYLIPVVRTNHLPGSAIDAREHVVVRFRTLPQGIHAYTLGMQKFVLPEFEIIGLLDSDLPAASRFMAVLCQTVLEGKPVKNGERLGSPKVFFEAREGGLDRGFWEGTSVMELLPPTTETPTRALSLWEAELLDP